MLRKEGRERQEEEKRKGGGVGWAPLTEEAALGQAETGLELLGRHGPEGGVLSVSRLHRDSDPWSERR